MDNNFNQQNNENQNSSSNSPFSTGNVNYNMGNAGQNNTKGMIIGLVLAFAAAALGVVIYCVMGYAANIIIFPMGAVILALEVFLYGKFAQNYNTIGLLVIVVFALVAIFLGTRMGTIFAYKGQWKDLYGSSISYGKAKDAWNLAKKLDDSISMEYVKNLAFGYIFSIGYAALYIANKKKKRK